jgi:hypothetical protein
MGSQVNIGGTWKNINGVYVNVGGLWKAASSMKCNIGGAWKDGWIAIDSYTKLLLHMDGADDGTVFIDQCGKTVTRGGSVVTKTGIKKIGTASAYFPGNSGDYLSLANSADWDPGSGDLTLEFWAYIASHTSEWRGLIAWDQYSPSTIRGWSLGISDTNKLTLFCSPDGTTVNGISVGSSGTLTTEQFVHIAVVKSGTSIKLYENGTQTGSGTLSSIYNCGQPLVIGGLNSNSPTSLFNGYIDELRISKGIARWTENFTPPTSPY